jgi:hypothetical protein
MPLGSFSGGCSSTAGYVPGNEAHRSEDRRATLHLWDDHFPLALTVFIRPTSDRFANQPAPSLSASASSVLDSGFPLLLPCERCVTTSVPPLGAGQNPRSDLDCETESTAKKYEVKYKIL